jgi:protein involved in polysaccharide export with SLBB domain
MMQALAGQMGGQQGQQMTSSGMPGQQGSEGGSVSPFGTLQTPQTSQQSFQRTPSISRSVPGQFTAPGFPGIYCVPSEPLSPIEASFEKQVPVELSAQVRQFGYTIFAAPAGASAGQAGPSSGTETQQTQPEFAAPAGAFASIQDIPVGPSYVLGVGDEMTIYIWGRVESVLPMKVDRNGEIFIPSIGKLRVWGLSFEKAEELIRDHLARVYSGFRTSITLGRLRTIRVYVVGEVAQPGAYNLSSLSTLTHALFASGGPTKQGTLRRITLQRDGRRLTEFDFYDFLMRGDKSKDVRLESDDTIFIPPIGPVAAALGDVKRPAIYEIKGETRAADLLTMAGGAAPGGYLLRVQLQRFEGNATRIVKDFSLADFYQRGVAEANPSLQDGDLLRVFPIDSRVYNVVFIEGFVRHPGYYEFRPGLRVADLLPRNELLPEAFVDRAEVVRLKVDQSTEVIPFSIKDAWAGKPEANLELHPLDRVVIGSEFRPGSSVQIAGQVRRPGRYAISEGERLSSLLERAGGFMPEAFPKGAVFTRETVRQNERIQMEKFIQTMDQTLLAEEAAYAGGEYGVGNLATANTLRQSLLRSLASTLTIGRLSIQLEPADRLRGTPNDILLEDGDFLTVPQYPTSITVIGAVRNSAAVLYKPDETIDYYIGRAGGVRQEGDVRQAYILKPDGSAIFSFAKMRKVDAGDAVVVPLSMEAKVRWAPFIKDLVTIVAQAAIPIGVIWGMMRQ